MKLNQIITQYMEEERFSGSVIVKKKDRISFEGSAGYSNRSEKLANNRRTRFGIASGCKLFTAIAICQLVEKGLLSFDSKVSECLHIKFRHFNKDITIHHLLIHTSGIPDYFDEEIMENFEDLWTFRPMYSIKRLEDFLPMFQMGKMMFSPGEKFHYNNAGFIVLGLIVEQKTGMAFNTYVEENIFKVCHMHDSGYFSLDQLPENTATGYIDQKDGTWKTNIYSIPIIGGADGGAYVTAEDMIKLWAGLFNYQLLDSNHTTQLLTPHVHVKDQTYYGYGIWMKSQKESIQKFHVMGYDPGVSFHSAYYPDTETSLAIPSNKSSGAFNLLKTIEKHLKIGE